LTEAPKLNESNPKFTIIVVVYNSASTIQRCIDTVLRQDYKNRELVIIDGGSTDDTLDILKANDSAIDCWISEPDTGIYNAMNKGVDRATGDWIIFLGADDFLFSDGALSRVARLLAFRETNPRLVYGKVAVVDRDCNTVSEWGEKSHQILGLPHQATFHHKSFFEVHGRFDESFKIAGDHEMLLRELKENEAEFLPDVVVSGFSLGGVSTSLDCAPRYWVEYARARKLNGLFPYPFCWLKSFTRALFFYGWVSLCRNGWMAWLRDRYNSQRAKSPSGIELNQSTDKPTSFIAVPDEKLKRY
jgi:glycosyltransferase involved in cell wall biosynthesis